jgi:UDP-N-acetylglucosamine--N-acetylmuramyl-(pentapeptide) pyrophosphoryl-undecaprenol N-acetylglucosamine transferase
MKILFCGGGTAGHVTPNIALIDQMHRHHELYYVGTSGMEKDLIAPLLPTGKVKQFLTISADKLARKFSLKALLLPFKLIKSVSESKKHLRAVRPDVVFSKGGYVGLPVVIAAKLLHIPAVVHESDMTMGLSNKLCSRFASTMLSTFDSEKATPVGAIVRQSIYSGDRQCGLDLMGFDGKKPILLVTGGSLGAGQLNDLIKGARALAEIFDIFVLTGKGKSIDCDFVHQAEFMSRMEDILAATAVAVTRAGSNSLIELTVKLIPFVTIPLTQHSRGEQVHNAEYFVKKHCGVGLFGDVTAQNLVNAVKAVYENLNYYRGYQEKLKLDGTKGVIEYILKAGE